MKERFDKKPPISKAALGCYISLRESQILSEKFQNTRSQCELSKCMLQETLEARARTKASLEQLEKQRVNRMAYLEGKSLRSSNSTLKKSVSNKVISFQPSPDKELSLSAEGYDEKALIRENQMLRERCMRSEKELKSLQKQHILLQMHTNEALKNRLREQKTDIDVSRTKITELIGNRTSTAANSDVKTKGEKFGG